MLHFQYYCLPPVDLPASIWHLGLPACCHFIINKHSPVHLPGAAHALLALALCLCSVDVSPRLHEDADTVSDRLEVEHKLLLRCEGELCRRCRPLVPGPWMLADAAPRMRGRGCPALPCCDGAPLHL